MKNNPFNLMFGRSPYSLIERQDPYQTIIDTFNSDTPSTFAYIISGIRGSGKTVMLSQIANYFSSKKNWIVIDINSQGNILKDVSEKTLYEAKKDNLFLNWSVNINAKIFTLEISKNEMITNQEIIFERILKELTSHGKKVLVTIDEVTPTNELKKFSNLFQSMNRKNYNLFLLMTGLRNNINTLINSEASSFLSRTPKINLLPLNLITISKEYQRLLNVSLPLATELAKLTNGYAFAYQVLGFIFFESNEKEINNTLLEKYDQYLQSNGYDVIWRDLTIQEKKLCFAISDSISKEKKEIMELSNMKKSNYQNYRGRLIEKEIIRSNGYDQIEFTLPRFKQFVEMMKYFD